MPDRSRPSAQRPDRRRPPGAGSHDPRARLRGRPRDRAEDHATRRRAARRLRAALWRARYVLAAGCCALAATLVVQALRPAPPPTVDVLVATHELVAGEAVRADDLTTRSVAASLVPDGALTDADDVVGRSPASTLPAGMPLHADLVGGGGVVAQAPHGTVVVPVRLDDATAGWLRAGDRVDLLAVTGDPEDGDDEPATDDADSGHYLARRALVLPPPPTARASDGGLLDVSGSPAAGADVTLVAVSPKEAPRLTAASGWGSVGAVLVP